MTISLKDLLAASSPSQPYSESAHYLHRHGSEIVQWIREARAWLQGDLDIGCWCEASKEHIKQLIDGVEE